MKPFEIISITKDTVACDGDGGALGEGKQTHESPPSGSAHSASLGGTLSMKFIEPMEMRMLPSVGWMMGLR